MFNINNLELVKMNNRPYNSALEQNMIFEQEAKFLSANGIYFFAEAQKSPLFVMKSILLQTR